MPNQFAESIEKIESMLARHPAGLAIIQVACEAAHSSGTVSMLCGYAVALAEFIGGKKLGSAPHSFGKLHASIRAALQDHPSAPRIFAPLSDEESGALPELAAWTVRMGEIVAGSSALPSGTVAISITPPGNQPNTLSTIEALRAQAAAEPDLGKRAVLLREIRVLRDGADWLAPQPDEPRRQKPRRDQ